MQRKIDTTDLDIPTSDIECWERYPRYRWVYELSRLLDSQSIRWSPFKTTELSEPHNNIMLYSSTGSSVTTSGIIYTKKHEEPAVQTEVYIVKGEIKLIRHLGSVTDTDDIIGGVELKINAFVAMHFSRFTGAISIVTHGNDIYRVQLKPQTQLGQNISSDVMKLIRRIYKKPESLLSGPADQSLRESLAS